MATHRRYALHFVEKDKGSDEKNINTEVIKEGIEKRTKVKQENGTLSLRN